MTFPVFLNGKILFRDGKPAFSTDCCCGGCPDYDLYFMNWEVSQLAQEPENPSFPTSIGDPGGTEPDAKLLFAAASWGQSPCVNSGSARLHCIYLTCPAWGGMGGAENELQAVLVGLNGAESSVTFSPASPGFQYPNPSTEQIYASVELDVTCEEDEYADGGITIHYPWQSVDVAALGCCD